MQPSVAVSQASQGRPLYIDILCYGLLNDFENLESY